MWYNGLDITADATLELDRGVSVETARPLDGFRRRSIRQW